MGWPTIQVLGGFTVEKRVIKTQISHTVDTAKSIVNDFKRDVILSEWDHHPNAKGHEQIAEFIYDRLG